MKEKFDKYRSKYSVIFAFTTILDSTKKLNFVKFEYSKLDPLTSEDKSKSVKMKLKKLYAEYVNNEIPSSNPELFTTSGATSFRKRNASFYRRS
jgi:hypothetical protein